MKDTLPSYLFQYGQILLPTVEEELNCKNFWYYPRGLKKGGRSYKLVLNLTLITKNYTLSHNLNKFLSSH